MFCFCDLIPAVTVEAKMLPVRLNSAICPMIFVRVLPVSTYIPGLTGRDDCDLWLKQAATNIAATKMKAPDSHDLLAPKKFPAAPAKLYMVRLTGNGVNGTNVERRKLNRESQE
jgi:hypothetical protein